MSEADAIQRSRARGPATARSLTRDLRALGVRPGQTLIVHTSLSGLGWVVGGPVAVLSALDAAVGAEGTLVMPTHTGYLTDPAPWRNPPVPESWWGPIRDEMPAFDPALTPSNRMGAVAEAFRTRPGAVRSDHPVGSFAACGPHAAAITAAHPLGDVFGDGSPLGRLYELGASALLLGVGHANNTALHLAEARVAGADADAWRTQGSPVLRGGRRVWATYRERVHDSDGFPAIGEAYAAAGRTVRTGPAGAGEATLAPVRELVDFAVGWMTDRRNADVEQAEPAPHDAAESPRDAAPSPP